MGLPRIDITLANGALGQTPQTSDGIAGFIHSGVAVVGKIALHEPKQLFSLEAAEALGLDADYDHDNGTEVYAQIRDFYKETGTSAELWIMLVADTETMASVLDKTNTDGAIKLLNEAEGSIKLLGIGRVPDGAYSLPQTTGLDDDVSAALMNGQALAMEQTERMRPLRIVISGRAWTGVVGDLNNLKEGTHNRCAVLLQSMGSGSVNAAVGMLLGRLSAIPVQRNAGRVKSPPLQITAAHLTDGNSIKDHTAVLGALHDKGYIVVRKYEGIAGFYFSDDPTATSATDDYNTISRGRVIDKAIVLTYITYVKELNDEAMLDDNGQIQKAGLKELQSNIETAIGQAMATKKEISAVSCEIDPNQDISATDRVKIKLRIVSVGYKKNIDIDLGFAASI